MNDRSLKTVDSSNPILVKYRQKIYDITEFVHKHPGGVNTLRGIENNDLAQRFATAPPHSSAAMYLLNEYKISESSRMCEKDLQVETNGKAVNDKLNNNNVPLEIDDSMEHLVDWSKPMVQQIGQLKNNYSEWVNKPVDRPLRLFGPTWIENLTKTPWWVVPIFWLPTIWYIFTIGRTEALQQKYSHHFIYSNLMTGLLLWTILEYSLHRWVFHLNHKGESSFVCTFHFLIHGLHHKVPFDPYRLVFPPVPALIIAIMLYQPLLLLFQFPKIILAGAVLGYVCYDMIHYYIHYGSPTNKYFYNLKRYHYQHHFVHHDKGFGISSPFWDIVFSTKIYLRKLQYLLKW